MSGAGNSYGAVICVEPGEGLADSPVCVRVSGLSPGAEASLIARATDEKGRQWCSSTLFAADDEGSFDLNHTAPLDGAYAGIDPMGFLWSMRPVDGCMTGAFLKYAQDPLDVELALYCEGAVVAQRSLRRVWLDDAIAVQEIASEQFVGKLFSPKAARPAPGVIVLGGTSGALHLSVASLLAVHGFSALALAYFGQPGLPPKHENIDIEYFSRAIDWLLTRPEVGVDGIGVVGISRGGEAALITAAHDERVRAVVSYNGSGVMFQSWNVNAEGGAAWRRAGEALPFLPVSIDRTQLAQSSEDHPFSTKNQFLAAMGDNDAVQQATPPLERINGSLLLIAGCDDSVWPSVELAEYVERYLKQKDFSFPVVRQNYSGAGHHLGYPSFLPSTVSISSRGGAFRELGGNSRDNAHADHDAWLRTVAFLTRHLDP